MKLCDKCEKEIKQVVTNGNEFFCSYKCRNEYFLERIEGKVSKVKAELEAALERALSDIRGYVWQLSKEWQTCNTCEMCGKVIDEGLKYCGAACKQRAYRERKAGNGGGDE